MARDTAILARAVALHTAGRRDAAIALLEQLVAAQPQWPEALYHLGDALDEVGRLEEAVALYRRALALDPGFTRPHYNLAYALQSLGRPAEAVPHFAAAIAAAPDHFKAHVNFGFALTTLDRFDDAAELFRRATVLRPDDPAGYLNLGFALVKLNRLDEAVAMFRRSVDLNPREILGYINLGATLRDLGRLGEATAAYESALRLDPDHAEAHSGYGMVLQALGEADAAADHYRAAIRLQPDLATAHLNLACGLLRQGDYAAGWQEFEWRPPAQLPAPLAARRWHGEPLGDRVLLLLAEQGLGDTVQFCRYVRLFPPGSRLVLAVQRPLRRLMESLAGVERLVAAGEALPPFDFVIPLMSLPRIFGTTVATIPHDVPYLKADAVASARWRERLDRRPGRNVGLVWSGDPRPHDTAQNAMDRRRSITLAQLAPLADLQGINWISLQKGRPAELAKSPPAGMILHDWTDELVDFADTAALVDVLDLVVSVDTSVAHLAGALAKPVWLLNRFDTDWRWLPGRDDSPWYPTLRQFRQDRPGDWEPAIAALCDALRSHLARDG